MWLCWKIGYRLYQARSRLHTYVNNIIKIINTFNEEVKFDEEFQRETNIYVKY